MRRVLAGIRREIPRQLWWRLTPIRLSWASGDDPNGNFGDQLSPHLVRRLFGARVIHSGMPTADLISTGSLLDWAETAVDRRRPMIWGSGFIADGPAWSGAGVRVLAVRGRQSLDRMRGVSRGDIALGDPGILTARAFPEHRAAAPRHELGIVPHFTEYDECRRAVAATHPDVAVINPCAPFAQVIEQITACGAIISSSLHGLIVAESYGVPNHWLSPGDGVTGGRYKFDDHFSTFDTHRDPLSLAELLAEHDSLTAQWQPLPGLTHRQDQLLSAFPLRPVTER